MFLGVVVLLLAAALVAGTVITVSAFTSSTKGGANLTAGDLALTLAPADSVVNTASMKPGDTRAGSVTLTNQKQAATYSLQFTGNTGALADVLQLTVSQTSPVSKQLYTGALSAAPAIALGSLGPAATMQLSFTYAWPAGSTSSALQGQSLSLVLQWTGRT